ncbi:response regulator transcription factor [Pleionea sediminis]|uniref:response regulator transcription factor n=1 Tax=Pleionea sediminis TaxID=2569479 RepID=UPI001185A3CF|nr:response regulator transcription factor [Pleionea sediminis]
MKNRIKIVIAEDQSMLLGALASLLDLEEDFQVIATAKSGTDALNLVLELSPDIFLTDIEMPEMSGLDIANELFKRNKSTKVIILTTFNRVGYLKRAMDSGVKGYLLKDSPSDSLADAIRKIESGRKVVDPELITDAWDQVDPLTEKERAVLQKAEAGLSTQAIAEQLNLSHGTVRNYLSNAASKLNAANRVEAARIARQKGWL